MTLKRTDLSVAWLSPNFRICISHQYSFVRRISSAELLISTTSRITTSVTFRTPQPRYSRAFSAPHSTVHNSTPLPLIDMSRSKEEQSQPKSSRTGNLNDTYELNSLNHSMSRKDSPPTNVQANDSHSPSDQDSRNVRRCPICEVPNTKPTQESHIRCVVCLESFDWDAIEMFDGTNSRGERCKPLEALTPAGLEAQLNQLAAADVKQSRSDEPPSKATSTGDQEVSVATQDSAGNATSSQTASLDRPRPQEENSITSERHFSASNEHAQAVRNQLNQAKASKTPNSPPKQENSSTNSDHDHHSNPSTKRPTKHTIPTIPPSNPPPSELSTLRPSDSSSSHITLVQPALHPPMIMAPNPVVVEAGFTAMTTQSAIQHNREAAKAQSRSRARAVEARSCWQRFLWRAQCGPCCEEPEGWWYQSPARGEDGTGHGHADGCCEMVGLRGCCCEGCGLSGRNGKKKKKSGHGANGVVSVNGCGTWSFHQHGRTGA